MQSKQFKIKNPTGLHARPAAELCALSKGFSSAITITCGEKTVNPRSVVSILTGGMACGKVIKMCAEGEDEGQAVEALTNFLESLEE